MKKVLFISPPRWNEMLYPATGAMGGMVKLPPIGMLFISSNLKKHCDVETRLFDYNIHEGQDYGLIDQTLREFKPDIVGITTYTFILYDVYRVAHHIRQMLPDAKIVFGGKHVQLYPREALAQDFVDYLVLGDGEDAMVELVRALEAGEAYPRIPGVWFRDAQGEIVDGGTAEAIKDLDVLPLPDIGLIAGSEKYGYRFGAGVPEATMYTSRGCPWRCAYCMSAYSDHRYYYHSPESVADSVEMYARAGYKIIHFMDDHFNLNLRRAKDVCRRLIERDLGITWTMRGSAKFIDEEFADLLEASGCERLNLGVESANEGILRSFDRKSDTEQIRRAFDMLDGRGIALAGYFILGFPGEDHEMAQRTVDLAKSMPLDFAQFTVLFPAPGTPYLHGLLRDGVMKKDIYVDYCLRPQPVFKLPYIEDKFTEQDVAQLVEDAYRQFYFRPSLAWRHARKLRSPVELYRKGVLAGGLAAFTMKKFLSGKKTNWSPEITAAQSANPSGVTFAKLYH